MLSSDEIRHRLTTTAPLAHWMRAYVDKAGNYWVAGNGGQGTAMFKKLEPTHPFNETIISMVQEGLLEKQIYQHEYYAQEVLARLAPRCTRE